MVELQILRVALGALSPLFRDVALVLVLFRVRLETHPDCASRRVSSMMEAA
jgi:hypothetical protein